MALAAMALAACSVLVSDGGIAVAPDLRTALQGVVLRPLPVPTATAPPELAGVEALVVTVDGWRVPDLALAAPVVERLRAFVRDGGRLVLLGYAAGLVEPLGLDGERPELEAFRWGYDSRTVAGVAELGIQVVSGRAPELFAGLARAAHDEFTFLCNGGHPCCVPTCTWLVGEPQHGEVLARLATIVDRAPEPPGPPVVVRWRDGKGEVLALGVQPGLDLADATLRDNARRLVRNLVGPARAVAALQLPGVAVPPPPPIVADAAAREVPGASLLAHWGWSARLAVASDHDHARSVDELVHDVLLPSWLAGADQLELVAVDGDGALPLDWSERDVLRRPRTFRGGALAGGFPPAAFAEVAAEAHGRSMLLTAFCGASPFGDSFAERLTTLRFVARELADRRRLGDGALDGIGLRRWSHDDRGFSLAMLQDFQPAAVLFGRAEVSPFLAGGLRALDSEDGAVRGLAATGLSARWRDGFPADLFPLGVLDARPQRVPPSRGGPGLGGGSYADWIVRQWNDFVRSRASGGGAVWWRTHDPETIGDAGDYVLGIGLDPLRAAVAMPLAATGRNGYRAAAARLVPDLPPEFVDAVDAPAAVHVLQNNWFRLLGSGGGLQYDASGTASFRAGEGLVVTPAFLRTRLIGGRPDAGLAHEVDVDLLQAGTAPAGGYAESVLVGPGGSSHLVPAMLAFDDRPQWPQQAQIEVGFAAGYHELEITPRPVRGRGVLVIALDGVVVHCEPLLGGQRAEPLVVPMHSPRAGLRTVSLAVAEGGTVALDHLRLVRRGDVAAEGATAIAAGNVAAIRESSSSSYHNDTVDLRTIGDFPGFVMRIQGQRSTRNLRVERSFHLPLHTELVAGDLEDRGLLRQPFVLGAADPAVPDLVIAPLLLSRYDHFRRKDGDLVLFSLAEAGTESRIGFWLLPHGQGKAFLRVAVAVLRAIDQPVVLDLGDGGEASLPCDLPVPWTRVVQLHSSWRTPYLVRENGWWTWRGAQEAPGGGDWLRVYQRPGDTVAIVGGPAVLARTHPGPGSLHTVALRDVEALAATVRVLQPSRLCAPAVEFAADFDEVLVDGEPWAWFDGRTVMLPDRVGDHRVEARVHAGAAAPHVSATRAPLRRCRYDPVGRVLELACDVDPTRPAELPFTAILQGPRPSGIDNGEIVDDGKLPHADATTRAAAEAAGVVIRFRPGVTKVRYGS